MISQYQALRQENHRRRNSRGKNPGRLTHLLWSMMMMTRAELERRLFILRGIVIEQRSAYTDSLWWWLHRRHIKRYDAIVDNIDALSQAARSWIDLTRAFDAVNEMEKT